MSIAPATESVPQRPGDYSLVGEDTRRAVEQGLAEADWYQTPVPREAMRELLARRDGPALRGRRMCGGCWPGSWGSRRPSSIFAA